MTTLFDGPIWTSYSQVLLASGAGDPLPDVAFLGQRNGLCGAAVSGSLFLVTGTHTGEIPVRVTRWDAAPEPGAWEEIVEADLLLGDGPVTLAGWASDPSAVFDLTPGRWRARWSGSGMDAARQHDATAEHPASDRYELSLWPSPEGAPDRIIRCTSEAAAHWHDQGFPRELGRRLDLLDVVEQRSSRLLDDEMALPEGLVTQRDRCGNEEGPGVESRAFSASLSRQSASTIARIRSAVSDGVLPTLTPAASRASFFA